MKAEMSDECLGQFLDPVHFLLTYELITCIDHYVIVITLSLIFKSINIKVKILDKKFVLKQIQRI